MFSGKKEKALEEELGLIKEQNAAQQEIIEQIARQQDDAAEQFARAMASTAELEKETQQMKEQLEQVTDIAETCETTAGDLHSQMVEANNAVETFVVNHTVFVKQQKEQNDKIMEVVENNKHFTTPMKSIMEFPGTCKEQQQAIFSRAERMTDYAKGMGVLSLNAAIEAGRMGECGTKFVTAAEEIRSFSEKYEKEAFELKEEVTQAEAKIKELEEQISHLNQLLKDNNISMTKLWKDSMMSMASYETGQLKLKNLLPEDILGRTDALRQAEKENGELQSKMKEELSVICEELQEQKSASDELEAIFKKLQQIAGEK